MNANTIVRFAPSPTGLLHIGNARTALFNWIYAKRRDGSFILRYDDTDVARSTRAFADAIAKDLEWLGVTPDQSVRQSDRSALYAAAADELRKLERLYACYETEEELEYRRRRQLALGRPPVYDRAGLNLSEEDHARFAAEGRPPHWRFLLDHRTVSWRDLVRGDQSIDCASLSDPVLIRGDGSYLYTLPSVVDDIDLGVTAVIRGEDHVTNTAVQIQIFETLSDRVPEFAHHNLLTLPSGEGLSKRLGHLSLSTLRDAGYEPSAVASLAVLIGTSHAVEPITDLLELTATFDLSSVSHSSAKFDPTELDALNARSLHRLPYEAVKARLLAFGIEGGEAFWTAVRGNLEKLADAVVWWRVVNADVDTIGAIEDRPLIEAASEQLPAEPWDQTTWAHWTEAVKAKTGRKGRDLFRPLRLALTGYEHGPELKVLLPLIGRARTRARLEQVLRATA